VKQNTKYQCRNLIGFKLLVSFKCKVDIQKIETSQMKSV